jgi:hypothetical protein
MTMNRRFYLNEARDIIDVLHPDRKVARGYEGAPKDEISLRESVLFDRIQSIVRQLAIPDDVRGNMSDRDRRLSDSDYRLIEQANDISWALYKAICASRLNTLDPALSLENKFDGSIKREKVGMQDYTSLSLFVDDVERLLHDLYGESDNQVMDQTRHAVLSIVESLAKYTCNELYQELEYARDIDLGWCGIGVPDGYGIGSSDVRRALVAENELASRARVVRASPASFSKYTVEFVKALDDHWPKLGQPSPEEEPSPA